MPYASPFLSSQLDAPAHAPRESGACRQRWLASGVLELAPRDGDADDFVLLSAGVHGNETAPVEVLGELVDAVLDGTLPLRVTLLIVLGHPQALQRGERYLDYDMNRLFDGAHRQHAGAREAARAAELESLTSAFFARAGKRRLHYDLHTAIRGSVFERFAIVPFQHGADADPQQLAWLAGAGIDALLLHSAPSTTFSYYSSARCQANAYTLELGKARPFGHNDLTRFAGITAQLRALISAAPARGAPLPPCFRAKYNLIKHSEAFRLHLAHDVENFTLLPDGMVIAEDGDTCYVARGGQERILFPNPGVKPGLRAGIVIEPLVPAQR